MSGFGDFLNSGPGIGLQAGIAGAAGAMPTNSTVTTSGTSSTTTNDVVNALQNLLSQQQQQSQQTQTTSLSPEGQQFLNQLMSKYGQMSNVNLQPYSAQQTQGINQAYNNQSKALDEIMAARGLSTSPVAGVAQGNVGLQRTGQITNLQQSLPLLQNQLQLQNLAGATSLMSQIPRTVSSTGITSATGSQTASGQTTSDQTQDQKFDQTQKTKAGGGIGGLLSGVGSVLGAAAMFSDKRIKTDIKDLKISKPISSSDIINKLKPKSFKYIGEDPSMPEHHGFVAQDIEKILPSAVMEHPSGLKMVNHAEILPHVVSMLQSMKGLNKMSAR